MNSPNPKWSPKTPIAAPHSSMRSLDPATLPLAELYKLMIGAIVPRPIALISTKNAAGVTNLAPFSYFNGVASNPPALMVAIARKADGSKKDTLRNIEETGEFVVNTASEWFAEAVISTGAEYPPGEDEMAEVGLTPLPSAVVAPPRVKESPIHLECRRLHLLEVGDGGAGSSTIVVGQIVQIHIAESVYQNGKIDPHALKPLARLGGHSYEIASPDFEFPIPKLPKRS